MSASAIIYSFNHAKTLQCRYDFQVLQNNVDIHLYNPVKNIFNDSDSFSSYAKRYFATKYMNIISVENNRICL